MTEGTEPAYCSECGGSLDPLGFEHECVRRCVVCDCREIAVGPHGGACEQHARRFPPALLKAAGDPFDYALRLVTGEIVYFNECDLYDGWAHVSAFDDDLRKSWHGTTPFEIKADRGLDVRLEHIVWVADAPWGS